MKRLLTTHSLLNAWEYIFKANDEETYSGEDNDSPEKLKKTAYESFLDILNRTSVQPTEAMIAGREFEQLVSVLAGFNADNAVIQTNIGASKIADIVSGGAEQVRLSKKVTINGIDYLLYGVLDWLKAGVIYDIKHKQSLYNYDAGDYFDNTQHRMYFALEDGAERFVYLISNNKEVYSEEYRRSEVRRIESTIIEFERWLKAQELWNIYVDKWQVRA